MSVSPANKFVAKRTGYLTGRCDETALSTRRLSTTACMLLV
jgi:hypothetical protein